METKHPISEEVEKLYNRNPEDEWQRLERHRTELAVTLRALQDYLPPFPARILDCGGGPGRYSIELAKWGYQVTLFDLSAKNLQLARKKASEAGVILQDYRHGNALNLSHYKADSFDAVLLMGPLYHLLEESERKQALAQAHRVLKPGGRIFATFISRYAGHREAASRQPLIVLTDKEVSDRILETGRLLPTGSGMDPFFGYFAHPSEIAPLVQSAGLEQVAVLGVEGLVFPNDTEVNKLTGDAWNAWVELNYRVSTDPYLYNSVSHLLLIAEKPRWRMVLSQIAAQLNHEKINYHLTGGASKALNGVPGPVNDIDIETDRAGALRFNELYKDHIILPVELSESEKYRSWFGRFSFDGVFVEVMGDLERRKGESWTSSSSKTEHIVDLEGVRVRVSWLEEETLAYIRRGRLETAAECLKYCNHVRLLQLLNGEVPTQVL